MAQHAIVTFLDVFGFMLKGTGTSSGENSMQN